MNQDPTEHPLLERRPTGPWPVTPGILDLAREAVLEGWRERARERGRPEPGDVSGSCKFASLLALELFGGHLRGNEDHQFLRLNSGEILDLNAGAADVVALDAPHDHDPSFWGTEDHLASLESCARRVARWRKAFEAKAAAVGLQPLSSAEEDPVRHEVLRRFRIVARLFDWGEDRCEGFLEELGTGSPGPAVPQPEDFGLSSEEADAPGREKRLTPAFARALGRLDAARALWSWRAPEPLPPDAAACRRHALAWSDSGAISTERLAVAPVRHEPAADLAPFAALWDAVPWLRSEHRASLADGMSGHADLLLQKIRQPCVVIDRGNGGVDILDGWHRIAAMIAAEQRVMSAVVVEDREPSAAPSP